MKLRSGRVIFNDSVEGHRFLNLYCSISQIKNRTIFRKRVKLMIKNWYLWLIKKHIQSPYVVTPWYLFSESLYTSWTGKESICSAFG